MQYISDLKDLGFLGFSFTLKAIETLCREFEENQ